MKCFHENAQKACDILRAAVRRIQAKDWTDVLKRNKVSFAFFSQGWSSVVFPFKEIARAAVMLPTGMPANDAAFPHI